MTPDVRRMYNNVSLKQKVRYKRAAKNGKEAYLMYRSKQVWGDLTVQRGKHRAPSRNIETKLFHFGFRTDVPKDLPPIPPSTPRIGFDDLPKPNHRSSEDFW